MESKLRKLLDTIYELEGLVHLALKRDDATGDFIRLISVKGEEVGAIVAGLNSSEESAEISSEESKENFYLEEYSIDEETDKYTGISQELPDSPGPSSKEDNLQRGKLVFSVNERFRFRRELFNGSDADFNNNLALVASMEDYEEAENYFINEEGFDRNNPAVAEFLEILIRYFK